MALSLVSGSSLSSSNKVAIIGDQTTEVSSFASRLYQTCLGRSPDPAGLDNWVNKFDI